MSAVLSPVSAFATLGAAPAGALVLPERRQFIHRVQAFFAALVLELCVLGAVLLLLALHKQAVPTPVVLLQIESLEQPEVIRPDPAPLPPPEPPPPVPRPPPMLRPPVTPPPAQAPPLAPVMAAAPSPVLPKAETPSELPAVVNASPAMAQTTVHAAPAPAPAPPPTVAAAVGPPMEYVAKVKAAVQAAFAYPAAAAALGFEGRVRVGFTLRGTNPSAARVLVSGGMGLVDRAAIQSVQNAHYPAPPASLKDADQTFEVWVEFKP